MRGCGAWGWHPNRRPLFLTGKFCGALDKTDLQKAAFPPKGKPVPTVVQTPRSHPGGRDHRLTTRPERASLTDQIAVIAVIHEGPDVR
jgi:hypothetical protein